MKLHFFIILIFNTMSFASPTKANLLKKGADLLSSNPKEARVIINDVINDFSKDLSLKPKAYESNFLTGKAFFYLEQDSVASAFFTTTIQHHPDSASPYFYRALIAKYANNLIPAKRDFQQAIRLSPNNSSYWFEYGKILSKTGSKDSAIVAYKTSIQLDSTKSSAVFNLGVIYHEIGNLEKSEQLYIKALIMDSTNTSTLHNLAQIYQMQGKYQKSLTHYSKLNQLNKNDWKSHTKLIQVLEALKKSEDADNEIEKLYNLKRSEEVSSLTKAPHFTREQFKTKNKLIIVHEYFELKGNKAIKYVFNVLDSTSKGLQYKISLGSYETSNKIAQETGEVKKGNRLFHLDGYYKNMHATYGFYDGIPNYRDVKNSVVEIINEKQEPISSTQYGN